MTQKSTNLIGKCVLVKQKSSLKARICREENTRVKQVLNQYSRHNRECVNENT